MLLGVAVVAFVVDLASKQWALTALADGQRRPLLGDLLGLRLIFNPGAAFSFGSSSTWVFTLVAVAVVAVVIRSARKLTSRLWAVALGLLLAGAIGNLVDRLFRPPGFGRGHVVDFIDYGRFIGNVADIYIVGAAAVLIVLSLLGVEPGRGEEAASAEVGAQREARPENDSREQADDG